MLWTWRRDWLFGWCCSEVRFPWKQSEIWVYSRQRRQNSPFIWKANHPSQVHCARLLSLELLTETFHAPFFRYGRRLRVKYSYINLSYFKIHYLSHKICVFFDRFNENMIRKAKFKFFSISWSVWKVPGSEHGALIVLVVQFLPLSNHPVQSTPYLPLLVSRSLFINYKILPYYHFALN